MRRGALTTAWAAPLLGLLAALALAAPASAALTFSPCPGTPNLGCARLAVPLDPANPSGRQIKLAVTRLLAGATPSQDAVVGLAGGPGQSAIPLTSSFALEMAPALQTRDLLVFDQRGTGSSDPLNCAALNLNAPPANVAATCATEIGPQRADFTTADSVSDIEALRVAGGYQKLVLFGTSYGTKVALEYAERYPQNVEALVLDSTVAPSGPDPLQRSTFAEIPIALDDLCSAGACNGISSNPIGEIARLVAQIDRKPLHGFIFNGHGDRVPATMVGADLLGLLIAGDLNPALRAELPAAVHAALRGDPAAILRLVALSEGFLPDGVRQPIAAARVPLSASPLQSSESAFDQALYLTTTCEESAFPWSPRNESAAARLAQSEAALRMIPSSALYPFDRESDYLTGNMPTCLKWPIASAPPPPDTTLPNVPTLILSGMDDLRTPTSDARLIAARIPDAQLLVVPHTGHSVLGSDLSTCSMTAVATFFAGQPIKPCGNIPNEFKPTPIPPRHLSDVPTTPGLGGRSGRTVTAVLDTLVDLRREIIGAILNADAALPSGARFGGLRGGEAAVTSTSVVLHGFAFIPGVTLTGSVPIALLTRGSGTAARIVVRGTSAAHGVVTLRSGRRASGTLGGHAFHVTLAGTADVTGDWPMPLLHGRAIIP